MIRRGGLIWGLCLIVGLIVAELGGVYGVGVCKVKWVKKARPRLMRK